MAEVQTTYSEAMPALLPGQVTDGETSNRISRTIEDASGIAFGKAAFDGVGDHGCTGTPTAGKFLGFVIADHGKALTLTGTPDVVGQYGTLGILPLGGIGIVTSVAVAKRDPVYITPAGAITNVASGNIAASIGGNQFTFDATAASGATVKVVRR